MFACSFLLQEFVLSIRELPRLVRFFPKILLAIIVSSCDEVYRKIAYWLNDMGILTFIKLFIFITLTLYTVLYFTSPFQVNVYIILGKTVLTPQCSSQAAPILQLLPPHKLGVIPHPSLWTYLKLALALFKYRISLLRMTHVSVNVCLYTWVLRFTV